VLYKIRTEWKRTGRNAIEQGSKEQNETEQTRTGRNVTE